MELKEKLKAIQGDLKMRRARLENDMQDERERAMKVLDGMLERAEVGRDTGLLEQNRHLQKILKDLEALKERSEELETTEIAIRLWLNQ